ncbi:MAG: PAS domain S-box protein [Candidatus Omnitrophota bacterium]
MKKALSEIISDKCFARTFEIEHDFSGIGHKTIVVKACFVEDMQMIMVALLDVTQCRLAVEEAKKAGVYLKSMFDFSIDAIAYADLEGEAIDVNKTFLELTGYSKESINTNGGFLNGTFGFLPDTGVVIIKKLFESGGSIEFEKEFTKKNGVHIFISGAFFLLKEENNKPIALTLIIRDITLRRQMEKDLNEKIKELEIFHEAAVTREFKIKELRDKIRELEKLIPAGQKAK